MAPFDGRAQRPVPGLGIPRAGEQVQPGIDPVQQLRGGEHPQPRGGQFQRERQPVQPRAEPVQDLRFPGRTPAAAARSCSSATASAADSGGTG